MKTLCGTLVSGIPRQTRLMALFLCIVVPSGHARGQIIVKDGESIAFLGDSITQEGWEREYGYVRVALQGLEAAGVKVTPVPAGVAGDTSERMLKRLDGILAKKPTWMTLSCGLNDVSPACAWRVGYEDFTKNVTAVLDKSQAAGVKVIILTPSLYKDVDPENETNQKAAAYVAYLRQQAEQRNLPLVDINAAHRAEIARLKNENSPRKTLLYDGIHMAPRGNLMMAASLLKTLGLTDEQIAKARERWLEAGYRRPITVWRDMNVRQLENAEAFAAREKIAYVDTVVQPLWERALATAAKAAPPNADMDTIRKAAQIQYGKDLDTLLDGSVSMKDLR
jgi:lysophospholipase L1-like esterase